MAFYTYDPSDNTSSRNPIQLNTFSSQRSRPTIPYKQFKKPNPQSLEQQEYRTSREYRTDLDDSEFVSSPDSEFPRPVSAMEGSAVRPASSTQPGHTRRRSTLMGSADGNSRGGSPNITTKGSSSADSKRGDESTGSDAASSDEDEVQDDEETGLNGEAKKKRSKRKRRATLLDQRLVPDGEISEEDKKEADQHVVKNILINGVLIGLWYIFSLSISIYNKWMFDPKHLDFHFPLFTTCMHMLVQFSLASLTLFFFPRFRPRYDSLTNPNNTRISESDRLRHEEAMRKPLMTRFFYFTRLGPCGLATGLDIGLGNMSLKFITLTFYTMVKSSSLAFVLLFAFLFRLESLSLRLVAIIALMTVGVILMVSGETAFSLLGFLLILSAAFFSGFRWALTQILLLRNPATSNPFASIFYLAPIMFLSLLLIALPVEGVPALIQGLKTLVEQKGMIMGPFILLFPGCIAFLMTSSEFALLQRTSVVTLSIAGIFKEVVTISAAALVFHDKMSPINISGLIVTIASISAYNYIKIRSMRDNARMKVACSKGEEAEYAGVDDEYSSEDEDYFTNDGDLLPKRPGVPRRVKSGRGVYGPPGH